MFETWGGDFCFDSCSTFRKVENSSKKYPPPQVSNILLEPRRKVYISVFQRPGHCSNRFGHLLSSNGELYKIKYSRLIRFFMASIFLRLSTPLKDNDVSFVKLANPAI